MDKKSWKVSVVIPAYNEEENIPILMDKMDKMFKKSAIDGEVVFVNDGSTDATAEKIEACLNKYHYVKAVAHVYNMGLTQSLTDGFSEAKGEILIFFPADLQYMPEDIPKLLEPFDKGYDIVTGWKQGYYNKRFVSRIYNYLSRKLFRVNVHDLNSIKAMKRKIMDSLILSYDWHRYLVVLAASKGFKIGEVKINVYPRKFGKSKFGFLSVLIGIIDLLIVRIYILFTNKPSLLFGLMSMLFFILGAAILILVFACFFIQQDFLMGISLKSWLLFEVILAIGGVLFLLVGYVVELITHIKIRLENTLDYLKKQNEKTNR